TGNTEIPALLPAPARFPQGSMDCPDLEFDYGDTDGLAPELSGTFGDCEDEGDVLRWSRHNSFLLYQMGTFSAFLELLNMEIERSGIQRMGDKRGEGAAEEFTLGGFEALQALKVQRRQELGLPPLPEASSRGHRGLPRARPAPPALPLPLQPLVKQDSLDIYNERDPFKNDEGGVDEEEADDVDGGIEGELDLMERDAVIPAVPAQCPPVEKVSFPKGLPWAPKVRQKDIEHFLEASRNKFIGFTLGQDTETLIGLPRPIHESVKTLKQHKYVSISDVQIKNEEELEKCPMSLGEEEVQETPCEVLYRAMLYNLPQYMIALLKILLAAAPTSKAKTDSINILADVLPEEMPTTVLQSMKLGIDVNRHKEIIVKSISAVLLLLLKHLKLNHIYQFEYVSQHLVFANCIPLILKFFNQNIMSYITAKNSISMLDYPYCTVHDLPELTAESL
ncbi:PREDICTED: LOW QUALITY PROTEIN: striatin-interacting protein 2-like, partial [Tinamus guttatus]|uniref:LOW QUALITY PROTEIN: striatin-interacting protein 2-like n=1 Tax=Tinamus guttatus TaxID=94827 RepID=UPI00052EAEE6